MLWLVPTDELFPRRGGYPSADQQRLFFDDTAAFFREHYGEPLSANVVVEDTRNKTLQDPEFARQVLGQQFVLRALSRFLEERGIERRIRVRFFDWTEILDVLDTLRLEPSAVIPDITVAPSTWVAYLASQGIIRPIQVADRTAYLEPALQMCDVRQLIPQWPWADRVAGRVMRAVGADWGWRRTVALPWFLDVRLFFYRRSGFTNGPPEDREEFVEAARRIAASSASTPFAMASEADWDLLHSFSLFLWAGGGDWMQRGGILGEEASETALHLLADLQRRGAVAFRQLRRSELEQQFLRGELSSIVSGPWLLRQLNDTLGPDWTTDVGVALPPFNAVGDDPVTFLGGSNLALTARAENDPDAQQLINYLSLDAPLMSAPALGSAIPATSEAFERLTTSHIVNRDLATLLRQAVARARRYPVIPEWASIVESQSTRIELFQFFKHVRESAPELAQRDLAALRRRFDWQMRHGPQLWLATSSAGTAFVMWATLWFSRRQKKLRAELVQIRHRWVVADVDLRATRESLISLSDELEAKVRASERLRYEPALLLAGPASVYDASPQTIAGDIERVRDDIRTKTAQLIELEQHRSAWQLSERQVLRALGGAKGPIKDIPRVSTFIPRLSAALDVAMATVAAGGRRAVQDSPQSAPAAGEATGTPLDRILGNSTAIHDLKQQIRQVAPTSVKVVLVGEVGTGKELAAEALHALSGRRGPFVSINCASIPTEMLEAELFGVGPNAGLPAMGRDGRAGSLEQADGGTVFLDEIGKMPHAQQAKLLRFLETGRIVRVMDRSAAGKKVDVRVVAAFSSDLGELVEAGAFDLALHSRLSEVRLRVPPLRERQDDIPLLVDAFLARFNREHRKGVSLRPSAYARIAHFEFPDNVRGLRNLVSRIVVFGGEVVEAQDIERLHLDSGARATADQNLLRQALQLEMFLPFVASAAFLVKHLHPFFPTSRAMPDVNAERVRDVLATIRRDLPRETGRAGAEYELPDVVSALVYRSEWEPDDLNVHFLYFLVIETLSQCGYHTGVGGGLSKAVRDQIEYVRRSLFYSEPVGRKARKGLQWRGIPLYDVARAAVVAHAAQLMADTLPPHRV